MEEMLATCSQKPSQLSQTAPKGSQHLSEREQHGPKWIQKVIENSVLEKGWLPDGSHSLLEPF